MIKRAIKFVKTIVWTIIALVVVGAGVVLTMDYFKYKSIGELLTENRKLKTSLSNLTQEDQIGYAKVVKQETKDGKFYTTLKFVETARNDKTNKILEKIYTIEGSVIYFDALIVKFGNQLVADGKERALFLWRRIYGETMSPESGYPIENSGQEPVRYKGIIDKLRMRDQSTFWNGIWDLANDQQKLSQIGVKAIYGNAVYTQLKPGLIYVFKISPSGEVYPETVPEM